MLETFVRDEEIEAKGPSFTKSGPLGSWSAKNKLAFVTGLVSQDAFHDLETMTKIGIASHILFRGRDFGSDQIADWCSNLRLIEKHFQTATTGVAIPNMNIEDRAARLRSPRWRYLMTAMLFTTGLLFRQTTQPRLSPAFSHRRMRCGEW